jgi:F-type H+-transporting ATPase subunit delta
LSRVAKRYAKALFGLAKDQGKLDKVETDFNELDKLIDKSSEFGAFLLNPLISGSDKSMMLKDLFKGKVDDLTFNFIQLINEKKRSSLLPDVILQFKSMMLEYNNQVEGELISAVELSKNQVNQIQQNIETATGKSVILKQRIETDVIGGFVLKIQDRVFDNSIRCQLNKLREKFIAR